MTREEAVRMIHELVSTEVQVMKEINSGRAKTSKKTDARERKAVSALFEALTGEKPTTEEWTDMVGV